MVECVLPGDRRAGSLIVPRHQIPIKRGRGRCSIGLGNLNGYMDQLFVNGEIGSYVVGLQWLL